MDAYSACEVSSHFGKGGAGRGDARFGSAGFGWSVVLGQGERTVFAELRFAEGFDSVTDCMGHGEIQAVVRNFFQFQRASHFETEAAAEQDKRNIIEGVGISFAEFVGPGNESVIEEGSGVTGFRRGR